MRKLLVPAVVLGLLVGAIGVAGAASDSAPGVTKDEIEFGVTYVDLEPIRSVTNTNHGDYEKSYNAVIDDLNKHGGSQRPQGRSDVRQDRPARHRAGAGGVPEAHRGRARCSRPWASS